MWISAPTNAPISLPWPRPKSHVTSTTPGPDTSSKQRAGPRTPRHTEESLSNSYAKYYSALGPSPESSKQTPTTTAQPDAVFEASTTNPRHPFYTWNPSDWLGDLEHVATPGPSPSTSSVPTATATPSTSIEAFPNSHDMEHHRLRLRHAYGLRAHGVDESDPHTFAKVDFGESWQLEGCLRRYPRLVELGVGSRQNPGAGGC